MELSLPTLTDGAGLVLRPLEEADAPAYAASFRDDRDLGRVVGAESDPDEADARRRVTQCVEAARSGRAVELAVSTGEVPFAGMFIALAFDERHRRCELGYWLAPGARGRGIGRRAGAVMLDWLFDELGMERIELETFPDNMAAKGLARSLGFVEEGVMRRRNLERGVRVDLALFALLREEWRPR